MFILKEPAHTVSKKDGWARAKKMSRQDIYGHKKRKLEKNVIQSVYQMTQEAVFA